MEGQGNQGSKKSSSRDNVPSNVHNMSVDDFKKTWLKLKELHDTDVDRLQSKLSNMEQEQLDKQTSLTAKIKTLTKHQEVLNNTIKDLKSQLSAKTCKNCTISEAYIRVLERECSHLREQNLKLHTDFKNELRILRRENKMLATEVKPEKELFHMTFSDSDDEPSTCRKNRLPLTFSIRDPPEGTSVGSPRSIRRRAQEEMTKSVGPEERQEKPKPSTPPPEEEIDDIPKTSSEGSSPDIVEPTPVRKHDRKSLMYVGTKLSFDPYQWHESENALQPDSKIQRQKRKHKSEASTPISTQKRKSESDLFWSISTVSSGAVQSTSHATIKTTRELKGILKKSSLHSQLKNIPSTVTLSCDRTLKCDEKTVTNTTADHNTELEERHISSQKLLIKQSASKKGTDETSHTQYVVGETSYTQYTAGETKYTKYAIGEISHTQCAAGKTKHVKYAVGEISHTQFATGEISHTQHAAEKRQDDFKSCSLDSALKKKDRTQPEKE